MHILMDVRESLRNKKNFCSVMAPLFKKCEEIYMTLREKYIYSFSEGNKQMDYLLGEKGANISEAYCMGLPIPVFVQEYSAWISSRKLHVRFNNLHTVGSQVYTAIFGAFSKDDYRIVCPKGKVFEIHSDSHVNPGGGII